MISHLRLLLCISVICLAGCATPPRPGAPARVDPIDRPVPVVQPELSPTLRALAGEAAALQPIAQSDLTRRFLAAVSALPPMAMRTAYLHEITREYFSPAARAALPAARKTTLVEVQLDEYRYYFAKQGSPLAYIRALDLAVDQNFKDIAGKRILDFGYGSIGQIRLMASMGAHVTGIDTDSYLAALYSDPADQGAIPLAPGATRRARGSIALAHGSWPGDPKIAALVGKGYELILSKNTLKRGYLKPERKVEDKRQQYDLGVTDQVFLSAIFNTLAPGGKLLIYNIYPKPATAKEKYRPAADGRSPFTRQQFEKAGLKVIAFDTEDHVLTRKMGKSLKWDQNSKGETIDNLESNLFALFTIVVRPLQ